MLENVPLVLLFFPKKQNSTLDHVSLSIYGGHYYIQSIQNLV